MNTIDYIYFRYYQYYLNKKGYLGIWNTPWVQASGFITTLVIFYTTIPILLYSYISEEKIIFDEKIFWTICILIYAINLYRYKKITNYESLAEKWENEDKEERRKKGVLIVLLITISFILIFGFGLIQASKH